MPSIDDQLRTRMREAAPRPAGADDLVEHLGARKRRRAALRRVSSTGLVAIVLLASVGTFFALGRAFRTSPVPAVTPTITTAITSAAGLIIASSQSAISKKRFRRGNYNRASLCNNSGPFRHASPKS